MDKKDSLSIVRKVREDISKAVNHDSRQLVEYYKKLQTRHKEKLLSKLPLSQCEEEKEAA